MSGPSAKELEKSAIKCGWLTKFGGNGLKSNWRKRWFVLHDDFLYYFKTQSDDEPCGVIFIPDFTDIEHAKDCKKSNFCWKLSNRAVSSGINLKDKLTDPGCEKENEDSNLPERPRPTRTYYAFGSNLDEMNSWISVIEPRLGSVSPQDIVNLDTSSLGSAPPTPPKTAEGSPLLVPLQTVEAPEADTSIDNLASSSLEADENSVESDAETLLNADQAERDADKKVPDEEESNQNINALAGVKLSSLDAKFKELDDMMSRLGSMQKSEFPVLHDMLRMVHLLLKKEKVRSEQ